MADETSFNFWDKTMSQLKGELNIILDIIPQGSKVIYVDYPVYYNIGDLLIMLGTAKFFQENNISLLNKFNVHNFPSNYNIPENVIIVCQGGGNFGDIWETHQNFRNKLMDQFSNTPIVILPQSIYFGKESNAKLVRNIFEGHRNNFVFVRERDSEAQLLKWLPNTQYSVCPDMAHMLWPGLYKGNNLGRNRLGLLRSDKEKSVSTTNISSMMDWEEIISQEDNEFALSIISKIGNEENVYQQWLEHAVKIVNRAINTFSDSSEIVTDRLHGHLLSCLMGIPNVFLPNAYHKNKSYYDTWTKPLANTVKFVDKP